MFDLFTQGRLTARCLCLRHDRAPWSLLSRSLIAAGIVIGVSRLVYIRVVCGVIEIDSIFV
jgi:hypothetical protein